MRLEFGLPEIGVKGRAGCGWLAWGQLQHVSDCRVSCHIWGTVMQAAEWSEAHALVACERHMCGACDMLVPVQLGSHRGSSAVITDCAPGVSPTCQ